MANPDGGVHVDYQRDEIPLSDGGCMSIDWCWPDQLRTARKDAKHDGATPPKKYKVIIVMPGIGGSSSRSYIRCLCRQFVSRGDEDYVVGVL